LCAFAPGLRAQSAAEIQKMQDQITEQQKLIQALQDSIAAQQKKLDEMKSATTAPAPTAAPAKPAAAPAPVVASAPAAAAPKVEAAKPAPAPKWYDKYTIRGYAQIRDNRVYTSNKSFTCQQCDSNMGNNSNFSIRRGRVIIQGDINDRVSLYFQNDFAQSSGNSLHFGQIRDLYADVALDKKKEFRIRPGQSKVPFGFENMQSSSNRLALDRSDAINSAAPGERDLGAFFYWAPAKIRTRLATLSSTGTSGLKGSGDYGVFGIGVYNGQSINKADANNNVHTVVRAAYPWQLKGGQVIEAGIQGYTGRYTVTPDQRSAGVKGPADFTFTDRRMAGSLVVYPQPLGFQAEYTVGKGPSYDPRSNTIRNKTLRGGYAQTMYMKKWKGQVFTPFYRFQYYSGGKKQELDARSYLVRDHDLGLEWQQSNFFEITGQYTFGDRRYEDASKLNNRQQGQVFRLQIQVNY
jgi:uncharacterized coiled-coil protein SlyX